MSKPLSPGLTLGLPLGRRLTRVALLSSAALAAPAAIAQTVPPPTTEVPVLANAGGAVVSQTGNVQTVYIGSDSRAIEWRTFNIGADATVSFTGAQGTPLTALNSVDAAGGLSQIYGRLVSQPNINIWLSNPSGMLMGPSGTFTGGSLVLTTAQIGGIAPGRINDPVAPLTTVELAGMPASAGVTIASAVDDGTGTGTLNGLQIQGNLLVAAQAVAVSGVVRATGTIDLVAAQTVQVALSQGSPIGVSITQGTTLGALNVGTGGVLAAGEMRVRAAAATGSDVLLGIDSGAQLTASSAGGRVLISAEAPGDGNAGTANIQTAGTIGGGSVTLQSIGLIADRGAATGSIAAGIGGIGVSGDGGVTLGSALGTTGSVSVVSSAGGVALGGSVSADLDYAVAGATDVSLGSGQAAVTQRAGRTVAVTAVGGGVFGVPALLLAADGAGSGITLAAGGTSGIAFATTSRIAAGVAAPAGSYDGSLTLNVATGAPIVLGAVDTGRIALPEANGTTTAGDFTAERLYVRDPLVLRSRTGTLTLGEVRAFAGGVTLGADTQAILVDRVQAAGDVTLTAGTDVAGRLASAGPDDGRLLVANGRATLIAEPVGARIAVVAGNAAQLGDVLAGAGLGGLDRTLNQVSVQANLIDAASAVDAAGAPTQLVQAGQGNLVLAGGGAVRIGRGDAAGGIEAFGGGGYSAGLVTSGDAQIGSLVARTGDIRLLVGNALTGLTLPGQAAPSPVADGLTLGTGAVAGDLDMVAAGDLFLGTAGVGGGASLASGANARIGSLSAGTGMSVVAGLSVTGLPTGGIAGASAGANLRADTGSIVLPQPGAAPPQVAMLGDVAAPLGSVSLAAGRLSAQSIVAGAAAGVQATGAALVIGSLSAGSATLSTGTVGNSGAPDTGELTVAFDRVADTASLRSGFGFADLTVLDADARLALTAGRAAQLGQVTAGSASEGVRTGDQITVAGEAVTIRNLIAANGGLAIAAGSGDLNLGLPSEETATLSSVVAQAGGGAALTKIGQTGLIRLAGTLTAGTQTGSAGDVTATSDTDLLGRAIRSQTGGITLRANGIVGGFGTGPSGGGDGLVIGSATVGNAALTAAGDVRIGTLTAATAIGIDAAGSVTGLGANQGSAALGLDLAADAGGVDVRGLSGTLSVADLGAVSARDGIAVAADAVSIASAATGGALLVDASGTGAGVAPFALFTTDDGTDAVEALASGYGFADLSVTDAGGTATVLAGGIAQLGQVSAGAGTAALTDGSGLAVPQVRVLAQAATVASARAVNGGLDITATGGGLYLGEGVAGTFATLTKAGATGTAADVDANELRVGTLTAGALRASDVALAGRTLIGSATGVRAGSVTANGTDDPSQGALVQLFADAGDATGLARGDAADGRLVGGYGRAGLFAPDAGARIAVSASGTAQLGDVLAGVTGGGTIDGSAADAALNQVVVRAAAIDAASAVDGSGQPAQRVGAGQGNIVLASGGGLRLGVGEAAAGVEEFSTGGARGAGLIAAGNAEVAQLIARTGDLRLRVAGALTGLVLPGTSVTYPGANDGLVLGSATVGTAAITAAGNARIGALAAQDALSVIAAGDVTGSAAQAAAPVADLFADRGSILLPDSGAPGQAALLGRVEAAGTVDLAAGILSVDRLSAGSATLTGTASGGTAGTELLVDASRRLRSGYGFADLSTSANGAPLRVQAGGAAQLGTVSAGDAGGAITAGNQLAVLADAVTINRAFAQNGALAVAARAGDLYLGDQVAAGDATTVALAATTATLLKGDAGGLGEPGAGLAWISGALRADDTVLIDSATGVRGRSIESRLGDVAITAATLVGGLGGSDGRLADLGARALIADALAPDGLRLADGLVGGAAVLDGSATAGANAVDVRIGRLASATRLDVAASGSVTGLAIADVPVAASLDVRAGGAIGIGAAAGTARLGSATIDQAIAGTTLSIEAGRVAVAGAASGGATTLVAGAGLTVDALDAGGAALLRVDAPASAAAVVALTTDNAADALAPAFGAAALSVTAAGNSPAPTSDVTGTIRVAAGQVAQLSQVTAGSGTATLITAAGDPREQIGVRAAALSVAGATAVNGALVLEADTGGLYLGQGRAALTATLTKRTAQGGVPDVTGNLVRIGTLDAGAAIGVTSDTSIRGTTLTSGADITLAATREISGAAAVAGPTGGLAIGRTVATGDVTFDTLGNLRLGSVEATGAVTLGADGSITGLRAIDVPPQGVDLIATGRVSVGGVDRAGVLTPLIQAALGRVVAGTGVTPPAVAVTAGIISAGSIETGGRVVLDAEQALVLGSLQSGSASVTVRGAGIDNEATELATRDDASSPAQPIGGVVASGGDWLASDAGFARILADGAVNVTAGRSAAFTGAAQLGTIRGASVAVTADALTIQRNLSADPVAANATAGALTLTATGGALYLGSGAASGSATLTKQGAGTDATIAARADELRIGTLSANDTASTSLTAATITATSATGMRVARAEATGADPAAIKLTAASGDVTGLRGGAVSGERAGIAPDWGRAVLNASADGARITATASGLAQLGLVTAGLTGGADLSVAAPAQVAVRAEAIDITAAAARNGALLLTARTGETRMGRGDARLGAIVQGTGAIRIGDLVTATRDIAITGGADVSGLALTTPAGDGRLLSGYDRANLTAQSATGRVVVDAAGTAQLGTVVAGVATSAALADSAPAQIAIRAQAADVSVASARNGALLVASGTGETRVAQGGARLGTTVQGTGAIRIGDLTAQTGAVTVAGGADVSGLALTAPVVDGRLLTGYGRANLTAEAAQTVVGVVGTGTVQLGTVAAGQGTAASRTLNQVTARGSAVDVASVTAANGNLVLDAGSGVVRLGQGDAGGGAEVYDAARQAYGVGARGATGVQIGTLTARTGDVRVQAIAGDVSGLIVPGGTGRATLTASATDRQIVVDARSGSALLGTLTAGAGATSAIEQIGVDARAIDVSAATTVNGALGLRASTGALTLGTGSIATVATLTKQGGDGRLNVTGSLTARDAVTLASTTDVELGGAVRATAGTGTILIDAVGSTAVGLGDGATGFALSTEELNRLDAPIITVDARANPLTIGQASLNTGGANTLLRLLGTGDVTLTGTLSGSGVNGSGAQRTLQIGGTRSATAIDANGLAQPGELAGRLLATLETGAGIGWAGGTVDLRARAIVFGDATLRSQVAASNPTGIALNLVANPNSVLYRGNLGRDFLTARLLQVRYRDYALLQNAGSSATTNGGVVLNPAGTTTGPVALDLRGPGDGGTDSFALFGTINGAVNRSAGLLPETVLQFAGGQPRVVRITQANSRVNGCVIGSPDRGCLNVDSPPPLIRLFDERQIQLFGTEENPDILFEPLIGTNNEALIGDLGGADVTGTVDCPTGQEATCPPATTSAPLSPATPGATPTSTAPAGANASQEAQ